MVHLRLGVICVAVLVGTSTLAGAASGSASAGKFSARLSKTSLTASQAGSVKLVCAFPKKSGSFSYLLTLKKGKKWQTVKAVKKVSYRKGSYTMTVKKVFAGKAVKLGSYRLKISAGSASKLLSFKVVKASTGGGGSNPPPTTGHQPAFTSLPTISGSTRQGETLTASPGTWTGSPTFTYEWRRCNSAGICSSISGASLITYVLALADVGSTIRLRVMALNSYGGASANSIPTSIVTGLPTTNPPPTNRSLPTISGTARQGQRLTASHGYWINSPTGYAYQWRRCDGAGSNCTDVGGATSSTYTPVVADVDGTVRVTVTASNSYGSASATSDQTGSVAPIPVNVSSGYEHSCALLSDGTVKCWGANEYGQLGNGTTTDSATPVLVSGIANAVQVSAGFTHTCALLSDKSVKCWGENSYGQLGDATTTERTTPVQVLGVGGSGTLGNVAQLSTGNGFTCVGLSGGTADCWGYNDDGELGDGMDPGPTYDSSTPVQVYLTGNASSGTPLTGVTAISAGSDHACVVAGGGVYCWGSDYDGQLGDGGSSSSANPVQVKGVSTGFLSGATQVSAGSWHTCALLSGGNVDCWGDNGTYQLGHSGAADPTRTPVQVYSSGTTPLANVLSVDAGTGHTCAVISGGALMCWGSNFDGQLGQSGPHTSVLPVHVMASGSAPLANVSEVSAGDAHTCAVLSIGELECWGDNSMDQLGTGVIGHSATPVHVLASPTATLANVSKLISGADHTCALLTDKTVWCWGANSDGQLGNGTTADNSTPTQVLGIGGSGFLSNVSQISAGYGHTCALITGGVVCWGADDGGQLGNGAALPADHSLYPVQVVGVGGTGFLPAMSQLSAGGWFTCARSSGSLYCWGSNYNGQLGNGSSGDGFGSWSPVQVKSDATHTVDDATDLSSGSTHACAIRAGGMVWCWGNNYYGQLGNGDSGSSADQAYPVKITGSLTASQVSAGELSTCLIRSVISAGTVYCWGYNANGELGNNSSDDSSLSVQVDGPDGVGSLTGATQLSVGTMHVCARLGDASVVCWGGNYSGELGDGTRFGSLFPTYTSLTSVSSVTANGDDGHNHSCALATDGTVYCWGSNYYGQLGVAGRGTSSYPRVVTGLS